MKKVSTAAVKTTKNFSQPKLTIGLDLGDRNSWYCVLDECGQIQAEQRVRTNVKALQEVFAKPFQEEKIRKPKPSSGDCVNRLAQVPLLKRTTGRQTDSSTG